MQNGHSGNRKYDDLDHYLHGNKSSDGPSHSGGSQSKHVSEALQGKSGRMLYPPDDLLEPGPKTTGEGVCTSTRTHPPRTGTEGDVWSYRKQRSYYYA